MNRAFRRLLVLTFLASGLAASGCGGARLSHDEIRKQVADLGNSTLVPSSVSIRRVVSQSSNRAIAETSVELAFQMERDSENSPWHITSVRLGDQNWVSVPELIAALNESKRKVTTGSLEKLNAGVATYRQKNGSLPPAKDIKALTDVLHPLYMRDLVLDDAWGHQILVESSTPTFRFRSVGPDGQRGTADDLLSPE
jgi:hypothetical protein